MTVFRVLHRRRYGSVPVRVAIYPFGVRSGRERRKLSALFEPTVFDTLRRRTPDPPGFDPNCVPKDPRTVIVETDGVRLSCHAVDSPDGRWTVAYGRQADGGGSRVLRLRGDDVTDSFVATHPTAGAVANDGTVAVVERGGSGTTVHRIRAFREGFERLDCTVEATVTGIAITRDGDSVAIATLRPDAAVHAYDVASGEPAWTTEPPRATPRLLGYHRNDDRDLLYVAREPRAEPYVAIDGTGAIVWGNERYRGTRPLSDRLRGWLNRRA